MKKPSAAPLALILALALQPLAVGQATAPELAQPDSPAPAAQPAPETERPISWAKLVPNILADQKPIWLFPLHAHRNRRWVPAVIILGVAAGLVAADPHDAPYFRRTDSFDGFNRVFSGSNTNYGILAAPVSLYIAGLARKNSKMQKTALLAAEALADAEILTTVLKDIGGRERPAAIAPDGDFSDTWFRSKGSVFRGRGSMPSGHTIAAFSIATVVSRRYGNHRWIPFVAYGLAGAIGFSRMSLSSHFPSEVFVGAALGYSVSRFAVLRQ